MSKLGDILTARATAWAAQRAEDEIRRGDDDEPLDSGIHPIHLSAQAIENGRRRSRRTSDVDLLAEEVTLVVYGWENVQPGAMSWTFANARQAIAAAQTMRNAVRWAILRGRHSADALATARASGALLLEHTR